MKQHIYFVDDELKICRAVKDTLAELPFVEVTCFSNPLACIDAIRQGNCDLLITDICMPKMNGIELLAKVRNLYPLLPIIVLTAHGDVPLAVQAMKEGAYDFIEKPLDENSLIPVVKNALNYHASNKSIITRLSKREREVLHWILKGKSNKEIAELLCRSLKTIEFHRYRLMCKLDVHNLADLIRRAEMLGLNPLRPRKT
jgi:FixJ family two-component response regulator